MIKYTFIVETDAKGEVQASAESAVSQPTPKELARFQGWFPGVVRTAQEMLAVEAERQLPAGS